MSPSPPAASAPTGDLGRVRRRRYLLRTVQLLIGLGLGLVVAEIAFWWRDDGAFPHVNLYVADAELGVRLEPGATERFALRHNPLTSIRINSAGYRGAELPPPTADEILVVGDSQVFGLGVEDGETFSARLAHLTGRQVVNAGVPTYGPLEYTAVAREMLATRKPSTVVYVINFANDLFENERPNRERHAVWDGWAVRIETAPDDVVSFPGRRWLFSQSHLFYAVRRWLHDDREAVDRGFESEGTWKDLVSTGEDALVRHDEAQRAHDGSAAERAARLEELRAKLAETEAEIEQQLFALVPEFAGGASESALQFQAARVSPGDIVRDNYAEGGRQIRVTAAHIAASVQVRRKLLRRYARGASGAESEKLREAASARDQLRAEELVVYSKEPAEPRVPSVLEPRLREIAELCASAGAELVVVALPIDVQVSSDQWAKYGVDDPPDLSATRVLLGDLVASAERLGARAIDVSDALAAVSAEAFLDGDIHMTPVGHRAVAEALAAKLEEPAPIPSPEPGLPEGRTRVPPPSAWLSTPEMNVKGSTAAGCRTQRIAEWFRATCLHQGSRRVPSAITVERGGHGEAMILVTDEAATLVVPILEGDEVDATFRWTTSSRSLTARWPAGAAAPEIRFGDATGGGAPLEVSEAAARLCACHEATRSELVCETDEYGRQHDCEPSCATLYGAPTAECLASYGDDCTALLACARGAPESLPRCPDGTVNAGGTGLCFALCDARHPCAEGTCTPYRGARVCR